MQDAHLLYESIYQHPGGSVFQIGSNRFQIASFFYYLDRKLQSSRSHHRNKLQGHQVLLKYKQDIILVFRNLKNDQLLADYSMRNR